MDNPKNIFNPALFWDAEDVSFEKHPDFIIKRILEYGDERDLKTLRGIYEDAAIIGVVKTRRGLSPRTRRFWMLYFSILPEDVIT